MVFFFSSESLSVPQLIFTTKISAVEKIFAGIFFVVIFFAGTFFVDREKKCKKLEPAKKLVPLGINYHKLRGTIQAATLYKALELLTDST